MHWYKTSQFNDPPMDPPMEPPAGAPEFKGRPSPGGGSAFMNAFQQHGQAEGWLADYDSFVQQNYGGVPTEQTAWAYLREIGDIPEWAQELCQHDWEYEETDANEDGTFDLFRCPKCGAGTAQPRGRRRY